MTPEFLASPSGSALHLHSLTRFSFSPGCGARCRARSGDRSSLLRFLKALQPKPRTEDRAGPEMTKGLVQPRLCPAARCAPGLPAARGEAAASGTLRRPRSDERKAAEGGGAARTALTQQTRLPGGAGLSQRALGPGGAARAAPAAAGRSLRRATPCAGTRLKSKPVGRCAAPGSSRSSHSCHKRGAPLLCTRCLVRA